MLTKIIKDLMKYFLITLLIMASLLYGCGRFENSPYGADAYSTQLNEQAVRQILAIPINKTSYKVAFISDTHNYYDEMEKLVNKINKGNYAFVIHAGDITNFGLNREFQTSLKILRKLKVPFITTAGNHDFLSHGDIIYRRIFGSPSYSFEFFGIQFIMMNNNNWESAEAGEAHEWLENELKSSKASRFIITAHVPPFDSARYNKEEIKRWKDIIAPYDVPYFFGGHDHNEVIIPFGNTTHVTIGSTVKKYYSEITITPTGVSHKKIHF